MTPYKYKCRIKQMSISWMRVCVYGPLRSCHMVTFWLFLSYTLCRVVIDFSTACITSKAKSGMKVKWEKTSHVARSGCF